jgi:hypothetical protein
MNIVGENFPRKIVEQINLRQQKKGAKNRNPEGDPSLLVWQNSNTGWVKMVSSVDVNLEERSKASNNQMAAALLPDSKLAEQYVLFGGVYYQGLGKDGLREGIARTNEIHQESAYGIGGLGLGLRPMPGITSFSIKTETRGSLKTATIGIKCYNKQQFDIINTLYLSLGYSVLIEWGNTMYYKDEKTFIKNNPYSLADDFLSSKYKWDEILPVIQKNRLESCGNYDAVLGKIVNFTWTVNRDLSYDVTVTIRTIGDVIESLKMNALSGFIPVEPSADLIQSVVGNSGIQNGIDLVKSAVLVKNIYDYLINEKGLNDDKARGILANMARESSFNIGAYRIDSNKKPSGGLLQWNGPRFNSMVNYVGTTSANGNWRTNWKKQIDFAFTEYETKKYEVQQFNSAEEASDWWVENWERPADIPKEKINRKELLKKFPPGLNYTQPTTPAQPLNSNEFYNNTAQTKKPGDTTSAQVISSYAYTHDIGALFYNIMIELQRNPVKKIGTDAVAVKKSFNNNGVLDDKYYIRFGYFLELLEKNIIYKLKGTEQSIIGFDYKTEDNIILLYDRQLSADPTVCAFQRQFTLSNKEIITLFPEFNTFILEGSNTDYTSYYGQLMNVYFDMTYILNQLQNLKDNDGNVTLIDLLKSLTDGFCSVTGNFNKILPTVNPDTNKIVFIDDTPLPASDRNKLLKKYSTNGIDANIEADFKMFGFYPVEGTNTALAGIVRDLSLTTTVSPNLASMITIGAQANGYITGQDSTALSTINLGLVDRIKNEWIEPINPNGYSSPPPPAYLQRRPNNTPSFDFYSQGIGANPQPDPSSNIPTFDDKYKNVIQQFSKFTQEIAGFSPTWNQEDIKAFSNSISSFAEYDQARKTLKQRQINPNASSPNIGFLPFDLTLVIDGLSGMKVYQKYIAGTDFLPSNYPQSLEFLIKGIRHELRDNQWITTLESLAIPKNPFGSTDSFNVGEKTTGARAPGASTSVRGNNFSTGRGGTTRVIEGITYRNGEIPSNKLRQINNAAKYKGDISSDGGKIRLYTKASLALDQLIAAAEQAGIPVKINSAYRTVSDQQRVYAENCPGGRCKIPTATPGTSNHGFGLAIDFATSGLKRIAPGDKLYDWLAAGNGAKFGFKRIASESWHWEYQNV